VAYYSGTMEQDLDHRPYDRGPMRHVLSVTWDVDAQRSLCVLECGHTVTRRRHTPERCYCEHCGRPPPAFVT